PGQLSLLAGQEHGRTIPLADIDSPFLNDCLGRYNAVCQVRGADMRRREFITALGGAAAMPFVANAQQARRVRRVGVLIPFPDESDSFTRESLSAFRQRLHELDWIEARNI